MLVATVNFVFRDSKGKTSTTRVRIPSTLTFAQYAEFAQGAAAVMKALTTAEITEVSVSVGLDLSGASLRTLATQFSDIVDKAFIQARNAINGLFGKFKIPTYDELNNSANSDQLNLADAEVMALVTLIEDGVTTSAGLVYPVTVRGDALSEVTLAYQQFRKS